MREKPADGAVTRVRRSARVAGLTLHVRGTLETRRPFVDNSCARHGELQHRGEKPERLAKARRPDHGGLIPQSGLKGKPNELSSYDRGRHTVAEIVTLISSRSLG